MSDLRITMTIGLLLILQIIFYHMAAATVYNYNETSEQIIYEPDPNFLSGFRNIIDKDFVIGGLFPVFDCRRSGLEDLELLEAMLFAIDRINNDMSLLPNLTIGYDVRDSCNSEIIGLNEALDLEMQYRTNNDRPTDMYTPVFLGIVGPAYTDVTSPVATVMSVIVFEVPLISYGSSDAALNNKDLYKYLLRTIPSDNLQTEAMVDLVSYFRWEFVNVIFSHNDYGISASNAFANSAMKHDICIDKEIDISLSKINETIQNLLESRATVVVLFIDNDTATSALFEELSKNNGTHKFVWISGDKWSNLQIQKTYVKFPEITKGIFSFQLHTNHVKEFDDYFSQLTSSTNIRNPFYHDPKYNFIYHHLYCTEYEAYGSENEDFGSGNESSSSGNEGSSSGYAEPVSTTSFDCPDDVTAEPVYAQRDMVPLVIDAVYAYAHALQNYLNDNCDSPLRWNRTTKQCDGVRYRLTGELFLSYLRYVKFMGIRNHNVSFDKNGDPTGAYEISYLQIDDSGQYKLISVGFWNSANKENALILNNTYGIEEVTSRCSDPCNDGMICVIILSCSLCFECIPCVGPTYSMNSSGINCSLCDDNYWGNNPLLGSTHCVLIKEQYLISGWSIISICIAIIALIILAVITVIFVINWRTPVVKSSGREQVVMLLIGIAACYFLTFVIISPPSTVACTFQRIGVWLCITLAFGALFVKILRVARIFYWHKSVAKKPSFTEPKYQVIFTMVIVAGQLILVAIGLAIDPPIAKRNPEVVKTSFTQTGNTPEIIKTCQQSHATILIMSLIYNSFIIIGCTILGWMTRRLPENFNEARHVMFTSFIVMVIWVLLMPLYLSTRKELQAGILTLGIILCAVALMAGIFFPRVYIIIFEKHKNNKEYASQQNHAANIGRPPLSNLPIAIKQGKHLASNVHMHSCINIRIKTRLLVSVFVWVMHATFNVSH